MSWAGMAAWPLVYAGMCLLAMAMPRHRGSMPWARLSRQAWLIRVIGWGCLAASVLVLLADYGPGIGLTSWFGMLSGVVVVVILQLSYGPASVWWGCLISLGLGVAALLRTIA